MPQVRDQYPGGKIEKSPAFRSPVKDTGTPRQNSLGRRIGAERPRFVGCSLVPGFIGDGFTGMMQGVFHGLNVSWVENNWVRLAGEAQHQASQWAVDFGNAARLAPGMAF